jgi:cytochrome c553
MPQGGVVQRSPRSILCTLLLLAAASSTGNTEEPGFDVPAWAFPGYTNPPPQDATHDDVVQLRVPESRVAFTRAELEDFFAAPDWFPEHHPAMPDIVARGRRPGTLACAYCHLPDGTGRPENAALAGLSADYIQAQVADMRSHVRKRAWTGPDRPSGLMQQVAESATEAEVAEAAAYFSQLPMRRKVEVIEAARVPRTEQVRFIYFALEGGGDEPLGARLLEVPVDSGRHEMRDPNVTYRAYVPVGSLARGKALATTTGASGATIACVTCHGADLRGSGASPPLAGRSPSYLLRQLLSFRAGTRATPAGAAMQPVVANLGIEDMIAVASYAGSLEP